MKTELIETGALIVRAHKGTPFYEAKWRDGRKRQRKRRLSRAWLEPDPRGGWKRRRGRRGVEHQVETPSHRPSRRAGSHELRRLRERPRFTSHTDYVFCRPDGAPLECSAVRSRFIRAQEQAGVRVRRFHDLRHTFGSLAIQQFDLVAAKDTMGHSKLTTTERYLHSKPRPDDVAKLTRVFG